MSSEKIRVEFFIKVKKGGRKLSGAEGCLTSAQLRGTDEEIIEASKPFLNDMREQAQEASEKLFERIYDLSSIREEGEAG